MKTSPANNSLLGRSNCLVEFCNSATLKSKPGLGMLTFLCLFTILMCYSMLSNNCFVEGQKQPQLKVCVNQTSTWNQNICNTNITMTYPSYCHHQNPFIVPYPLSYTLYNDSIVDLQACLDKNGNAQHEWSDECYFLNSLNIIELESFSAINQSSRYILFATNRGQLFGSDFNVGNVLLPLMGENNHFEPINKVVSVPYSKEKGVYVIGKAKQHSIMYYYGQDEKLFTPCSMLTNSEMIYSDILYMEDKDEIFLLLIGEDRIYFSKLGAKCDIEEKVYTYQFTGEKVVDIQVTTQHYNISTQTASVYIKDDHPFRNIISIQTSKSLYLIPFERENKIFDITSVGFNLVYRVSSSLDDSKTTISGHTIFKEEIVKATGGECSTMPTENYQALYIGVATYNSDTGSSKMILRNLNSWSYERSDIQCDVTLGVYPVDGKCVKAFEYVQTLPHKVIHLKSTFIDLPVEVKNQILGITAQYANSTAAAINSVEPLCEQMAGVSTLMNKGSDFMTNYKVCLATFQSAMNGAGQCSSLLDIIPPDTVKELMLYHWMQNIFITMEDNSLFIFGAQSRACQSSVERGLVVNEYNRFKLVGRPLELGISPNGQHIFLTLTRKKWEIDALIRYNDICKTLKKDENNLFFSSFADTCKENPPTEPNIGLFGFSLSYCFPGLYCPNIKETVITKVDGGFYTERPNYAITCPKGSFCTSGSKALCPPGFYCDEEGMEAPKRCMDNDYNCFKTGLQQPNNTPDKGTLTLTPYYPTIPISDGLFILRSNETQYSVSECSKGEYCPLGREVQFNSTENINITRRSLYCPDNTYCNDPHIITPTICKCNFTYCSYCVEGSSKESPCPAGYYCTSPSKKKACSIGQYCPEGTVIPQVCPAGYYCEAPSSMAACPFSHYCPSGSIVPRACSFLSICSGNQEHESFNILGFLFVFICSLVVIVIFYAIRFGRKLWNDYIDKKRQGIQPQVSQVELVNSSEKKPEGVSIVFEKLSYHVNGKSILNEVSGIIPPSRLTAIMGPSGCGKTTLLSILAGRVYEGSIDGIIKINNTIDSFSSLKKITGFVPQNDIMHPNLTVKETIHFAARTKLDFRLAGKQVSSIISNVIETLGLSHIKHSIIGDQDKRGISGGQKKRVNIGIELAADPKVLFLDEPTSGLDSVSSKEVMFALNRIATEQNVTVAAVIHQPRTEIFEMFHNVILLETGGRLVYNGPSANALPYFEKLGYKVENPKTNPADFILDVTSGQVQNENKQISLSQVWEKHSSTSFFKVDQQNLLACSNYEDIKKENSRRTTLITTQLWLCLRRTLIQFTRSVFDFLLGVTLVYIGGLACGVIFSDGLHYKGPPHEEIIKLCPEPLRLKCAMPLDDPLITMAQIIPLGMALCGVMSSLSIFGDELTVFKREYSSGLSTSMYFIAKNIVHIPYILIYPAIYTSIFYILSNPLGSFWDYYGYLVLVYNVAVGLGYLLSILLRPTVSKLAGVVVVIVTTMLAGARPTIPQMTDMFFPMNILHWVSFLRYSQEIIYLIEIEKYSQIFNIQTSLDIFGYAFGNWWSGVALTCFAIGFRILAYFALLLVPDTIFIKRWFRWLINRRFAIKNFFSKKNQNRKKEYVVEASPVSIKDDKQSPTMTPYSRM